MNFPTKMKKIFFILIAFATLVSCEDKECQQSLVSANEELEAYRRMSQGMLQITSILDSIDRGQNYLSEVGKDDTLTRDLVLERIAKAMSNIETSNLKVLEMEESMSKFSGDTEGMKNMIARLRYSLKEKTDSLKSLTARLEAVEDENISLASAVFEKEREIKTKNNMINQQKKDLVITQNELLMREKEAIIAEGDAARSRVLIEATKFFERGVAEEALGDKLGGLFKGKEKQERYKTAYDNYKKAYDMGKSEGKRAMIKVKEKIKDK